LTGTGLKADIDYACPADFQHMQTLPSGIRKATHRSPSFATRH